MRGHLGAEELVAALDGELAPQRQVHLERCARCRTSWQEIGQMLDAARPAGEVPEPSPLDWDDLSARIRQATSQEPVPRRTGRAQRVGPWGTWLASGLAAAALAGVVLQPGQVPPAGDPEAAATEAWADVVAVAGLLSTEHMYDALPEDPVGLVEDLTPAELQAFAALLEREMEALE